MFAERKSVTITTDGSGDGTGYISVPHGRVWSLHYVKDDFADGVDFAITVESTGEGLWTESDVNASASRRPRAAVNDLVGGDAEFGTGFDVVEPALLANDRIEFVVANGGAEKSGTFVAIIG